MANQPADNLFFRLGEQLEDLDIGLQRLATQIVDEMRRNVPIDKGNLKESIQVTMDRFGFQISMLEYGFYQNYGVKPDANPSAGAHKPFGNEFGSIKQPFGVIVDDQVFGDFQYNNRRFGLPSRQFFDLDDYQERLIELVENQIEEIT